MLFDGFGVLFQLTLHIVERGFCVIELNLPRLGASVVFPKRVACVLQRPFERFYLLTLRLYLFGQYTVLRGKAFNGGGILIECRIDQLHFRA